MHPSNLPPASLQFPSNLPPISLHFHKQWPESWESWEDWLGIPYTYGEACEAVRRLELADAAAYGTLVRGESVEPTLPQGAVAFARHAPAGKRRELAEYTRLPVAPERYYADEWVSWEAFLQGETTAAA